MLSTIDIAWFFIKGLFLKKDRLPTVDYFTSVIVPQHKFFSITEFQKWKACPLDGIVEKVFKEPSKKRKNPILSPSSQLPVP